MRLLKTLLVVMLLGSPAGAEELSGTLQKVRESNRIALGFQEASIPFSYLDGDQKPVGYSLDVCLTIVDAVRQKLGLADLKVEFVPVISSTRIPLLANGTVDLVCGSATNNAERQRLVAYTNTHFLSATRFAAKKAQNVKTIADLKGKAVVAVSGSTNLLQLNRVNTERNLGITVLPAKDQLEAFLMLETDRVAAYVMDDIQLSVAIARSKAPADYMIGDETFSKAEPFGIMLRKDDAPFKAVADQATATLYRSPRIEAIYGKWFTSPVPPNGVNFNAPMADVLRYALAHPSDSPDPASYER